MSVSAIIISGLAVGGTGILIGFILGIFGEKFKVEVDEREEAILEVLRVLSLLWLYRHVSWNNTP